MTSGWILLDKPSGMTSRKAGGIVARALGAKTFGHLGTLDPMASGLLPIALGNATKMIPYLEECRGESHSPKKEYLFSVIWGLETDTLDVTGNILNQSSSSLIPQPSNLRAACAALVGPLLQTPPQYSAVSVGGVRAYKAARAGKHIEIPPREIMIYELEYMGDNKFRVVCSPGTYVRVLAQQICEQINKSNHDFICTVDMIRRTATNGFEIKDATTLDFPENLCNDLKPVDFGLGDIPVWNLDKTGADVFLHGGFIELTEHRAQSTHLVRVYCENKFIGIGNTESGILKPKRVIN